MSLINCPECNKEVSSAAASCPSCGHPLESRDKPATPVVAATPKDPRQVPKWVIPAVVVVAAFALFGFVYAMQTSSDPERSEITVAAEDERVAVPSDRAVVVTPEVDTPAQDPSTLEAKVPENDQTVNPEIKSKVAGDIKTLGSVEINARVMNTEGNTEAVEEEKFYLLNKELAEILEDSNLRPIAGQNLVNSFGLSVLYPEKFEKFNERSLSAINDHIEYDTLTGSNGVATIRNVRPGNYFLFGIHKIGKGFAIWSSPVSIRAGENKLNIQPQRPVEFEDNI